MIKIPDVHLGPQGVKPLDIKVLVCDIDGTVADGSHRQHFIQNKPKNWAAYQKLSHLDTPIQWVIDLVREFYFSNTKVLMVSGRGEQEREVTEKWLMKHLVPYDNLYMRPKLDYSADNLVKEKILNQLTTMGLRPDLVLDDRDRVVKMWRENNVKCIQVAEGDF